MSGLWDDRRSPQDLTGWVCWIGKTGWSCGRGLIDRISENHNLWGGGNCSRNFLLADDSSTLRLASFVRRPGIDACRGEFGTQLSVIVSRIHKNASRACSPIKSERVCLPTCRGVLRVPHRFWSSKGPPNKHKAVPRRMPNHCDGWRYRWATAFGMIPKSEPGGEFGDVA